MSQFTDTLLRHFKLDLESGNSSSLEMRTGLLFEQAGVSTLVVLLNAIVLVVAHLYFTSQAPVLFLMATFALVFARTCTIWEFKLTDRSSKICQRKFASVYIVSVICTAFLFGYAGWAHFDSLNTTYQTFIVFVIGGTAAGAVAVLSSVPRLAGYYNMIVFVPVFIKSLMNGTEYSYAIALMIFLAMVSMIKASRQSERAVSAALRLQMQENEAALLREEQEVLRRGYLNQLSNSQEQLDRALHSAQAAHVAKAAFLATMGHELRTPLNGIIGLTDLVLDSNLDEEQRNYLDLVRISSHSLLRSVNDVLDYANLEAGRLNLKNAVFCMHDVLSDISEFYSFRAKEAGVDMHLVLSEQAPLVCNGDAGRITQILNHLVDNAIKFSEPGSVVLLLVMASGAQSDESFQVTFAVSDTGIGVSSDQELITESFSQGDEEHSTRSYDGSGLGLAIVDKLLSLMGSSLEMQTIKNFGSRFSFELNLENATQQQGSELQPGPFMEQSTESEVKQRILIAEDNIINQKLYRAILADQPAELTFANNGREACKHFREQAFDLVLMDCHMPVMDGFAATRQIRQAEQGSTSRVPILALTSFQHHEVQGECEESGMDGFIVKPVNRADLLSLVQLHLRKRKTSEFAPESGA